MRGTKTYDHHLQRWTFVLECNQGPLLSFHMGCDYSPISCEITRRYFIVPSNRLGPIWHRCVDLRKSCSPNRFLPWRHLILSLARQQGNWTLAKHQTCDWSNGFLDHNIKSMRSVLILNWDNLKIVYRDIYLLFSRALVTSYDIHEIQFMTFAKRIIANKAHLFI